MEKERLAEYLERYHLGANSAATSRELELTFGIKGIEVRHLVNRLRRDGVPIASSGSGYFYAATEQEAVSYTHLPTDKDHWIIDEDAAPVVKRIFDLAIDGKGPEQIARILEKDKVCLLYTSRCV